MKYRDSKGREVEIIQIEGEYGEGVNVIDAMYVDELDEEIAHVSDSELDYLSAHYQAELYQSWYESKIDSAMSRYED